MHVQLNSNGYPLSHLDQDRLAESIAHIDRLTDTFPDRRLHVTIESLGHGEACQVRVLLTMLKHHLVAVDRAPSVAPAAQRCADILAEQIQLSKSRVHKNHGERAIRRAKEEAELEDAVAAEVGRRMKYHPEAEARLGRGLTFDDIVEAVMAYASEHAVARPGNVPYRDWVLGLVDERIDEVAAKAAASEDLAA